MIHPDLLALLIFRHDTNGLSLLDPLAANDAEVFHIFGCPFDISRLVPCGSDDFSSLFPDLFRFLINRGFSLLLHHWNSLPFSSSHKHEGGLLSSLSRMERVPGRFDS